MLALSLTARWFEKGEREDDDDNDDDMLCVRACVNVSV